MKARIRTPELYHADQLGFGPTTTIDKHPHNIHVLVRPLSMSGINMLQRLRMAWGVFTGKYDAVRWIEPNNRDLPRDENRHD